MLGNNRIIRIVKVVVFLFSISCLTSAKLYGYGGGVSYSPRNFKSIKARAISPDYVIRVYNQKAFDDLQVCLKKAIKGGYKSIEVRFAPGKYYFSQTHIALERLKCPDVSIRFIGNHCQLIPNGDEIVVNRKLAKPLDYKCSYITNDGKDANLWSPFYYTDSLIEVVNKDEKACRIHVPSECPLDVSGIMDGYIQYTEWYYTRTCKIDSISNNYVYFKVPELFRVQGYYNVNYDYRWHKLYPRFRIFDTFPKIQNILKGVFSLHEGQCGALCTITDSEFLKVSFEDFFITG